MSKRTIKVRAEILRREWVEFELMDAAGIVETVTWKGWGCHKLLEAAEKLALSFPNKKIADLAWNLPADNLSFQHWDLMMREIIAKIQGRFKLPYQEEELCHCRKIPTQRVDEAVVLGAHTPEKVRAWTTASSGCGTCRPDVEKMIEYRLKKA